MTDKPLISIVMGSYNRLEFLKLAIDSARQETADIPHEIIVVDGGSDDGSLEWLIWQKDIITIVQHNRGEWNSKPIPRRSWGYFMNLAFKSAQAEYILMMSDDTIFHPHAVKNALTFIEQQLAQGKRVGAVPFYFHDVIGEPEHRYKVGVLFGLTFLNHGIYRKSALEAVGYADETTYTFYAADVDLSYKLIDAGYEIIPCKTALMLHHIQHPLRPIDKSSEFWMRDVTALIQKWKGKLIHEDAIIIEEGHTDFDVLEYHDPDNLAHVFETAIQQITHTQGVEDTSVGQSDVAFTLLQLNVRIHGLLKTLQYNLLVHQKLEARFLKNPDYYQHTWRWTLPIPVANFLLTIKRRFTKSHNPMRDDSDQAPSFTHLSIQLDEVITLLRKHMRLLKNLYRQVKRRANFE